MVTLLTIFIMYRFYRWLIKIDNTPDEELSEIAKHFKHCDGEIVPPGYMVRKKKRH